MTMYLLGLDLGQAADYSALAIAKRQEERGVASYQMPWLERFELGTSYPAIVTAVVARVGQLATQEPTVPRVLVVDATGVGRPVVDLLVRAKPAARLIAVTITGVPKRELVSTAQVFLQGRRLAIADKLPEAATLTRELLAFQVKISAETAHDSYGAWREGSHDDLVLAVALALWAGERPEVRGRPFTPSVGGYRRELDPDAPPLTDREMLAPFDGRGTTPGDVPIAAFGRGRRDY
jgi:hypothetical protein